MLPDTGCADMAESLASLFALVIVSIIPPSARGEDPVVWYDR